jgi:hypothetical protein
MPVSECLQRSRVCLTFSLNAQQIIILNSISFMAFLMPAEQMAERLALVVTLILALLAFQYTINDKLPNTGYVTYLHQFISDSNIMLLVVALESCLVHWLHSNRMQLMFTRLRMACWRMIGPRICFRSVHVAVHPTGDMTNDTKEPKAENNAPEVTRRQSILHTLHAVEDFAADTLVAIHIHPIDLVFLVACPVVFASLAADVM